LTETRDCFVFFDPEHLPKQKEKKVALHVQYTIYSVLWILR